MEEQKPEASPPSGASVPPKKSRTGLWVGVAAIVVVVVIVLALFALGVFNPPAARTPLNIGAVLSLTGGLKSYGPDIQKAIQMAISEINAQGGVNGTDVHLYVADDQTTPAVGATAATTLIQQNHVSAIIGALASGVSAAIVSVCVQNQVVQVSPASTSPLFTNLTFTQGWFYRTVPSDGLQGVVAAHYAYTNRSWRNVAIIAINNPYGNGLAGVFNRTFTSLGGHITVTEIVPEAQASYSTALTDVFSHGAVDGIYFIAYPDTGGQLMKDWWGNHASWPAQWLFSEGLQTQDFVDNMTANGLTVSAMQGSAPTSPTGPLYDSFALRFQAAYGHAPGLFASEGYDATYMIALAAMKANAVTGPAIKSQMIAISGGSAGTGTKVYPGPGNYTTATQTSGVLNYEGASGSLNWNQYGDPTSSYEIWGMNATNKIVEIEFFPEAQVIAWTA